MSSLKPKQNINIRKEYAFELGLLSAAILILVVFVLAIAISNPSYYVLLGGV